MAQGGAQRRHLRLALRDLFLGRHRDDDTHARDFLRQLGWRGSVFFVDDNFAGDLQTGKPLLEKWGRDSKILDIFEGTQQINLMIIARRILGAAREHRCRNVTR